MGRLARIVANVSLLVVGCGCAGTEGSHARDEDEPTDIETQLRPPTEPPGADVGARDDGAPSPSPEPDPNAKPTWHGGTLKLMPLGDSVTEGWVHVPGGYRIRLWQRLVQQDKLDIDFVGSLQHGPKTLADRDHEGHTGWRIDQLRAKVDAWLAARQPDVVLLHIGTNDVVQKFDMAKAPDRLADLAARICDQRPGVRLVVASIIPRPGLATLVDTYNAKIPAIVDGLRSRGCATSFLDMNQALTNADLDESATHPTRTGFDKMADAWYPVVKALYDSP